MTEHFGHTTIFDFKSSSVFVYTPINQYLAFKYSKYPNAGYTANAEVVSTVARGFHFPVYHGKLQATSSSMRPSHDMFCAVCKKDGASRCTGCKARLYCGLFKILSKSTSIPITIIGKECQRADWPKHKLECQKGNKWYDRYRLCRDGHKHHGKLEIMTWGSPEEETGWGNCLLEECEDLKRKFELRSRV